MNRILPAISALMVSFFIADASANENLQAAKLPEVETPYRTPKPLPQAARGKDSVQSLDELNLAADYERYRALVRRDGFFAVEESLQSGLASSDRKTRNEAKAALATFYLAHGLGEEALSVLGEEQGATASEVNIFLKGAALIEMARYEDAVMLFKSVTMRRHPAARAWRGIALENLGAFETGLKDLTAADQHMIPPGQGAARYYLSKAACAIASGDSAIALAALKELRKAPIDDDARHKRAYLEAKLQALNGNTVNAQQQFVRLRDFGAQPYASLAALETLRLRRNAGAISLSDALAALEHLVLTWKGGQFERETLFTLGDWREQAGDIAGAFDARRKLLSNDAGSDLAQAARARMTATLAGLAASNDRPPAQVAEIFYENIDLAPPGAEGDALIHEIAEDLVALDLLRPASELLDHQVFNRLRGAERSIAAADLAVIYLANNRPDDALRVIRSTRHARLPDYINQRRRIIEATALWETVKPEAALALLQNVEGREEAVLRGDIYWREKQWARAANAYAAALLEGETDKTKLIEKDRDTLYRAIAAFSLARDAAAYNEFKDRISEINSGAGVAALLTALSVSATDEEVSQLLVLYRAAMAEPNLGG